MPYQFEPSGKLKELTAEELAAADADSAVIVFNRGVVEDDGRPYWLYIAVKPSKYRGFMQATRDGRTIRFEEYGEILEYGFEADAPLKVKDEMKRRYGCDDDYMESLNRDVFNAQVAFFKQQESDRLGNIVAMLKQTQGNG